MLGDVSGAVGKLILSAKKGGWLWAFELTKIAAFGC